MTLKRYLFAYISLLGALVIIYGNSFSCSWHFDDYANIVDNGNVHPASLTWEELKPSFYGLHGVKGKIKRPLSYFSFAVNYYIHKDRVQEYHVVNFAIHYLASMVLFLFLVNVLQLPAINPYIRERAYSISLLSVFFWSTHPISVTAVTYIVQRMTSLSGLCYIMCLYLFVKARTGTEKNKRTMLFAGCVITSVLSMAAKESAAMLPVVLFLLDLFLIQGLSASSIRKSMKMVTPLLAVALIAALYTADVSALLNGYDNRPFTLGERLLTQPRVLLFHLYQFVYPVSANFTFLHDVEVSRTILSPWTTLPACLVILTLIAAAVICRGKSPLIAFCVLFFFINHMVEGTILPLEIIYEHRNYVPGMLFFVPVSLAWVYVLDFFKGTTPIRGLMIICLIVFLAAQGHTAYMRNLTFKDEISFWTDNVNKAGNLNRTHHGLGRALFRAGYYEAAVSEMKKALDARSGARIDQKYMSHFNLGTFYLTAGKYDRALEQFLKSIGYKPDNASAHNAAGIAYMNLNDLELSERHIRRAVSLAPGSAVFQKNLRHVLEARRAAK